MVLTGATEVVINNLILEGGVSKSAGVNESNSSFISSYSSYGYREGGMFSGGAIEVVGAAASLTVSRSRFESCRASWSGGAVGCSEAACIFTDVVFSNCVGAAKCAALCMLSSLHLLSLFSQFRAESKHLRFQTF